MGNSKNQWAIMFTQARAVLFLVFSLPQIKNKAKFSVWKRRGTQARIWQFWESEAVKLSRRKRLLHWITNI